MKKGLIAVLLLALGMLSLPVRADVVLLIHGYLSGAQGWDTHGVSGALERAGWKRAGSGHHFMMVSNPTRQCGMTQTKRSPMKSGRFTFRRAFNLSQQSVFNLLGM